MVWLFRFIFHSLPPFSFILLSQRPATQCVRKMHRGRVGRDSECARAKRDMRKRQYAFNVLPYCVPSACDARMHLNHLKM